MVLLISIVFALGIAEAADHVCPSSRGEWIDWRESVLRNPSTPYTLAEEVFSFEGCRDRIPNELRSCFGRLFDFARFNHSAVSNLAPPTTFSNRPVDVPSSFRNVGLLKRIVDSDSTVGAQQVAVRELFFGEPGAIGVSYRSSIGPTEDSYVFFQEGSQTDTWYHLNRVRDRRDNVGPHFLQVIKLAKATRPPQIQFGQYQIGDRELLRMEEGNLCGACHRTAAMPLLPFPETPEVSVLIDGGSGKSGSELISFLNGKVSDSSHIRTHLQREMGHAFGPDLGIPMQRDEVYLKTLLSLSQFPSGVSPTKLARAMNCMSCHNTNNAALPGSISYPLVGHELGNFLTKRLIEIGHMPPGLGSQLNPVEKDLLWKLLSAEYNGGFGDVSVSYGNVRVGTLLTWLRNSAACSEVDGSREPASRHSDRKIKRIVPTPRASSRARKR